MLFLPHSLIKFSIWYTRKQQTRILVFDMFLLCRKRRWMRETCLQRGGSISKSMEPSFWIQPWWLTAWGGISRSRWCRHRTLAARLFCIFNRFNRMRGFSDPLWGWGYAVTYKFCGYGTAASSNSPSQEGTSSSVSLLEEHVGNLLIHTVPVCSLRRYAGSNFVSLLFKCFSCSNRWTDTGSILIYMQSNTENVYHLDWYDEVQEMRFIWIMYVHLEVLCFLSSINKNLNYYIFLYDYTWCNAQCRDCFIRNICMWSEKIFWLQFKIFSREAIHLKEWNDTFITLHWYQKSKVKINLTNLDE